MWSNEHKVKDRISKKASEFLDRKASEIERIRDEIAALEAKKSVLTGRKRVREYFSLERKVKKLKVKKNDLERDKPISELVERVKPLLAKSDTNAVLDQQRRSVFEHLFEDEDRLLPCFVNRDVCPKCQFKLVRFTKESMNVCPNCRHVRHVIYCSSDYIQFEDPKESEYERGPLFKRYLEQFHEDAEPPPDHVVKTVCRHLFNVHIMVSTKVKPTPIIQILRQEGLQKYTCMAVRIAKVINNEPIVKLSNEIIDRLVIRFNKITHAFSLVKKRERKKIMNFEFLAKQFLMMESRPDLAEYFKLHKTRQVLFNAEKRMQKCCDAMAEDELEWNASRSC